jgi:hypothetical protein
MDQAVAEHDKFHADVTTAVAESWNESIRPPVFRVVLTSRRSQVVHGKSVKVASLGTLIVSGNQVAAQTNRAKSSRGPLSAALNG